MSNRALISLLRRSVTTTRTKTLRGGATPPMPPYARIPAPSEPVSLFLNHDHNDALQSSSPKIVCNEILIRLHRELLSLCLSLN